MSKTFLLKVLGRKGANKKLLKGKSQPTKNLTVTYSRYKHTSCEEVLKKNLHQNFLYVVFGLLLCYLDVHSNEDNQISGKSLSPHVLGFGLNKKELNSCQL